MDIYMKRVALTPSGHNSSYPNPLFGGIPDFYTLKIYLLQGAENSLLQNLPNELLLGQFNNLWLCTKVLLNSEAPLGDLGL